MTALPKNKDPYVCYYYIGLTMTKSCSRVSVYRTNCTKKNRKLYYLIIYICFSNFLSVSFFWIMLFFFWIVLVVFPIECLNLTALQSTLNVLGKMKTLNHYDVEECSLFCKEDEYLKDKDFILLQVVLLSY